MAFVVTEACIKCKFTDCVDVCPVDCFHEGENMLVINPNECIDCGVCEPECPISAIVPDTAQEGLKWLEHNRHFSTKWPIITQKIIPNEDANKWKDVSEKFKFFNPAPAKRE